MKLTNALERTLSLSVVAGLCFSAMALGLTAQANSMTRYAEFTPTYKTVTTYRSEQRCTTREGGDELGGAIIGGLIGSAVGNQASSADGAGALGTFLGAIVGAESAKKPKTTCTTHQVPSGSYQKLTGYEVIIDGSVYWVPVK